MVDVGEFDQSAPASVRKQIVDLLVARLTGLADKPLPAALGNVRITKNRSTAVSDDKMPMYGLYFINGQPTPVGGDARRAVLNSNKLLIECRVIVRGTDDDADPHCVWVTERIVSADRCIAADGTQLALGVTEAETLFEPLEGTQGEVVVTRIRFLVEYTTRRTDITQVG